MLYTGKEIAEKYSTETIKITENNIWRWSQKGLKHIVGPHSRFLYKMEWVDNFLEEQAEKNASKTIITDFEVKNVKTKLNNIMLTRIFKLVQENKLTAKEFAEGAGIAGTSLTDWKTGRSKPSMDALRKIAKAYKVQLEWLTGDCKYRTKEEEFAKLIEQKGEEK